MAEVDSGGNVNDRTSGMIGVVAQAGATPPYYYVGLAALVVALIWAGVLAYRSWEEAHEELDPATKEELLDAFQQARMEGELDDEEFAKIRRRIEEADR